MNKRMKVIIAVAALTVAVGVGAVSAYLTDQAAQRNTIVIGSNTIELVENYEPPEKINTVGDTVFKKEVQVKNVGNVDCYIRVFCEFSDPVMRDMAAISFNSWGGQMSDKEFHESPPKGWAYYGEGPLSGYFYYTEKLRPGDSTGRLLDRVKITVPEGFSDIRDFEIIVYAESVQAVKAGGTDGNRKEYENYMEAWTDLLETQ